MRMLPRYLAASRLLCLAACTLAACSSSPSDAPAELGSELTLRIEAETQAWTASSGDATSAGTMNRRLSANAVGDRFSFDTSVAAGTYTVTIRYSTRNLYGNYDVLVNSTKIGALSGYSTSTSDAWTTTKLSNVTVNGSTNFAFAVTGKNAAATDYDIKVDYIELVSTTTTGSGGTGGTSGTAGSAGSAGSAGASGSGGATGSGGGSASACVNGTTGTTFATSCPIAPYRTCTSGTWVVPGPSTGPVETGMTLRHESTHFAFYWKDGTNITLAQAQSAATTLESIWSTYFGAPMYMPEPFCDQTTKYKAGIHIDNTYPLYGGAYSAGSVTRIPGMWVGPGAASDHWGLGHEFMHGVQSHWGGLANNGGRDYIGWIFESHANFAPHQLSEYASNVHCSEMLVNAPHVYLGSTRDRYCNWQFMEYLKDKECHRAVNDIWTMSPAVNDPFTAIMKSRGWTLPQMNDFFGDWAMHNVTWDYKTSGPAFRATYGDITDTSRPERRNRLTRVEPLDASFATNRRFRSPYYQAPQRYGYNVIRLMPEAGKSQVTVTFRGVVQAGADSDWRWGIVATNAARTTTRYSPLQKGSDGTLSFCFSSGEQLFLVVTATPSVQKQIYWDQPYASIHRYPYLFEVNGAWPEGYQNGALDACPSGTVRHPNGNGCAVSGLASSVYVGANARVLGGSVTGNARIEDNATILSGATVSGGTVGGLSVLNRFNVSGSAVVRATFYPPGFFEASQGASGTAQLLGDLEYRGDGLNKSSGSYSGFVDSTTASMAVTEVTTPPPYAWRN